MKEEINPQKSAIGERRFNKKFTKLKISEKSTGKFKKIGV